MAIKSDGCAGTCHGDKRIWTQDFEKFYFSLFELTPLLMEAEFLVFVFTLQQLPLSTVMIHHNSAQNSQSCR